MSRTDCLAQVDPIQSVIGLSITKGAVLSISKQELLNVCLGYNIRLYLIFNLNLNISYFWISSFPIFRPELLASGPLVLRVCDWLTTSLAFPGLPLPNSRPWDLLLASMIKGTNSLQQMSSWQLHPYSTTPLPCSVFLKKKNLDLEYYICTYTLITLKILL